MAPDAKQVEGWGAMSTTNYGISYCKKVIQDLERIENQMFEDLGHGFDKSSQEWKHLCNYKRWLKQFERERELGLKPSYDPEFHGP